MKTLIFIISSFFILSCTHDNDTRNIIFTEIGKGELYGNGDEGIPESNLVITNNTDWQNLMTKMNTVNNVTDNFAETDIDFNTYEVIAVFLEVKPSGWEIKITEITEDDTNIHVCKTEKYFEYCVMTQPFHIVKIPKSNKQVVFE